MKTNTIIKVSSKGMHLAKTLDCGQCFRWELKDDKWQGVIANKVIKVSLDGEFLVCEGDISEEQLLTYFDLNTDYEAMEQNFLKYESLKAALDYAGGIRILQQDSFEATITFILSQNNNISRIKGLVARLCENFGEPIGDGIFSFPTKEQLEFVTEEQLGVVRSGFRAKYIVDAVARINSGEVNLQEILTLPLPEAEKELMKIKGIGIKVADCALLFGFHRLEAFPVDVWIKRALKFFFKDGFPAELEPVQGYAQQLLFHYIRTSPDTEGYRQAERDEKKAEKESKAKK